MISLVNILFDNTKPKQKPRVVGCDLHRSMKLCARSLALVNDFLAELAFRVASNKKVSLVSKDVVTIKTYLS